MDQLELKHVETIGDCYASYAVTRPDGSILSTVIINANSAPATVRVYRSDLIRPETLLTLIELPE